MVVWMFAALIWSVYPVATQARNSGSCSGNYPDVLDQGKSNLIRTMLWKSDFLLYFTGFTHKSANLEKAMRLEKRSHVFQCLNSSMILWKSKLMPSSQDAVKTSTECFPFLKMLKTQTRKGERWKVGDPWIQETEWANFILGFELSWKMMSSWTPCNTHCYHAPLSCFIEHKHFQLQFI